MKKIGKKTHESDGQFFLKIQNESISICVNIKIKKEIFDCSIMFSTFGVLFM